MKSSEPEKKGIPGIKLLYAIIGLVGVGLISISIGVNLVWLNPFADKLKQSAIDYEIVQAKRAANSIENAIEIEMTDIQRLAQDISVSKNPKFFINRFLEGNPDIKEASIINLEGKEQKRYSRSKYFTKKDLRDFGFLKEFEKAKKGKTFISNVNFTEEAEPYLKITTPIRKSKRAEPQAVLRIIFHLRGIWKEAVEMKVGKTGRVLVIDDKGMLIASPNPSRVLKKVNLLTFPPTKPLIRGKVFEGAKYLNEKGVEVIGVGAPIKTLGWGVIAEQTLTEVEASAQEVKSIATIVWITGIIVIGLLIWLALTIKRTNRELIEKNLALETRTEQLEEARKTLEIRVKARTKELRELNENLEEKVQKRTEELQKSKEELQDRVNELEKFHNVTVGRELKMIELKKENKELKEKLEEVKKKIEKLKEEG